MTVQPTEFRPVVHDDVAWLGTDPIPTAPYYDPAYFELEREAVFKRTWLQIAHISELPEPGCYIVRPVEIAKASVLIVHGRDGKVRAFHNVCTHRGTELVGTASGKTSTFVCPYHSWTFGQDGRLVAAPDFERFYIDKAACSLKQVAADVCGGLIYINFAKQPAQDLRTFLGPVAEKLDTLLVARATAFSEFTYEIDANWKVNYDNFMENYHLRNVHPRTGAVMVGAQNPFGYPIKYTFMGPHRSQTLWRDPTAAKPQALQTLAYGRAAVFGAAEGLTHAEVDGKMFPNMYMVGQPTFFFTHVIMPLTPTKTRGVFRMYWVGADDCATRRFTREFTMASVRDVITEDRGIIAAGQRGLNTGAISHLNFQLHEVMCRHSFQTVNGMVEAYKAELRAGEAQA